VKLIRKLKISEKSQIQHSKHSIQSNKKTSLRIDDLKKLISCR